MELYIVTGLSGAGKSHALRRLEDMGCFCVDNMPADMLKSFVELCSKAVTPITHAAVVVDSRGSVFKADTELILSQLDNLGTHCTILFLDCRDDILERRYCETRRRHPLDDDIRAGIEKERAILGILRDRADYIIDTTDLKPIELMAKLEQIMSQEISEAFSLVFESFGYKRGVPFEADVVIDTRFSKNPFYEPELRNLSGVDKPVKDFVLNDPNMTTLLDDLEEQLTRLIPCFIQQNKHKLLVAFGCTGGRHRSVCLAEEMRRRMADKYDVRVMHRDTAVEADDIIGRNLGGR